MRVAIIIAVALSTTHAWGDDAPPVSEAPAKETPNAKPNNGPPPDEPTAADVARAPLPGHESGRLDSQDDGDSTLRDVGQGVLVVPRVAVEVVFAPVRASVWAFDRYHLVTRFKQLFFDDDYIYGLYPTLHIDSSYTYGATLGARFVHRDLFGAREHLAVRAGAGGEFRQLLTGGFRTGNRLGRRVRFELNGDIERRPNDGFYGIGNTTDGAESRHRQEIERVRSTLDVRVVRDLHVRASGALTDLEYAPSTEGPPIDMIYDTMTLTGWTGARNVYGELELSWDSRRSVRPWDLDSVYATGILLSTYAGPVHQFEAGHDYWRYGGELQHFLRLGAGPRALVTRVHVEAVTGEAEDVAFTQLPRLGGKRLLRGYARDQFRDRAAVLGSLEYQWDLGKFLVASMFVDAGRVFPSLSLPEPTNLRVGYGTSLQLHADHQFIGALSIASSIDGGFFLNLAFDPVFDVEPRVEQR